MPKKPAFFYADSKLGKAVASLLADIREIKRDLEREKHKTQLDALALEVISLAIDGISLMNDVIKKFDNRQHPSMIRFAGIVVRGGLLLTNVMKLRGTGANGAPKLKEIKKALTTPYARKMLIACMKVINILDSIDEKEDLFAFIDKEYILNHSLIGKLKSTLGKDQPKDGKAALDKIKFEAKDLDSINKLILDNTSTASAYILELLTNFYRNNAEESRIENIQYLAFHQLEINFDTIKASLNKDDNTNYPVEHWIALQSVAGNLLQSLKAPQADYILNLDPSPIEMIFTAKKVADMVDQLTQFLREIDLRIDFAKQNESVNVTADDVIKHYRDLKIIISPSERVELTIELEREVGAITEDDAKNEKIKSLGNILARNNFLEDYLSEQAELFKLLIETKLKFERNRKHLQFAVEMHQHHPNDRSIAFQRSMQAILDQLDPLDDLQSALATLTQSALQTAPAGLHCQELLTQLSQDFDFIKRDVENLVFAQDKLNLEIAARDESVRKVVDQLIARQKSIHDIAAKTNHQIICKFDKCNNSVTTLLEKMDSYAATGSPTTLETFKEEQAEMAGWNFSPIVDQFVLSITKPDINIAVQLDEPLQRAVDKLKNFGKKSDPESLLIRNMGLEVEHTLKHFYANHDRDQLTKKDKNLLAGTVKEIIRQNDFLISKHRSKIKAIIGNILIGITGVGAILIAGHLAYTKNKTGKAFAFFQERDLKSRKLKAKTKTLSRLIKA